MMNTIKLGLHRGALEIKQFARQRESVVFTIFFPLILMVIFGSVFKAIMIPMERDAGALKRLRGTPMPIASYFIGKSILVLSSMFIQTILLVAGGVAFFGLKLPATSEKWWLFILLLVLGSANSTALGIAFSALPKSGRGASAVVSPVVIILQFFSGVFFIFTQLPSWMQQVAAIFPLKWLTQGMREVFLPDSFAAQEVAKSWETGRGISINLIWLVLGVALAIKTFRWDRD